MEEAIEVDEVAPLSTELNRKGGRRNNNAFHGSMKNMADNNVGSNAVEVGVSEERFAESKNAPNYGECLQEATVSEFDYSVDNHFSAIDTISRLCGEPDIEDSDAHEIERLSSSTMFLREWKYFNYQSRNIRFASQNEDFQRKDVTGGISISQFSSASVPKDSHNEKSVSFRSRKDFVMFVGGPVWALDWCPRVHRPACDFKSEFLAVGTHPPDSLYHKLGAPLTGRGIIQIWCLLDVGSKDDLFPLLATEKVKRNSKKAESFNAISSQQKRPRGRPRKKPIVGPSNIMECSNQYIQPLAIQHHEDSLTLVPSDDNSSQPKRPRGRPRKKPIVGPSNIMEGSSQYIQPLAVKYPEDSLNLVPFDGVSGDSSEHINKEDANRHLQGVEGMLKCNADIPPTKDRATKITRKRKNVQTNNLPLPALNENEEPSLLSPQASAVVVTNDFIDHNFPVKNKEDSDSIPKHVAIPRLVLCLAHNGKVAWDVKWRPSNTCSKLTMGYLAVLLGNGALEVWEVPFPHTMKVMYSAHQSEGTDPRFVKLEPVFRCSKLKCGDRKSIPLTMEWSTSSPHDFILAGCHDGVVALWRFSPTTSSEDTRPLICFSADTVPIRSVAWAPSESDSESAHVIVTAGHKGLKFWDLRDPFRPLWDLNPVQRVIYSLDWLPDPRCVITSFDDGTLRILSLAKAASDVPATGKPFTGTQHQGLNSYFCSSFAIWNVHVSRLSGIVAYCSADGNVLCFQLTTKAVEKDPLRNRAPHYLCGSLVEEDSWLTVVTPLPDIPFPMKKSLHEWGDTPRTIKGFLSVSNKEKRAKEQMAKAKTSNHQPLALCYGDDPEIELGSNGTMASSKKKGTPKIMGNSKSKQKSKEALMCKDAGDSNSKGDDIDERGNVEDEIDVFPPKIVAMHRVRWNMNKGSGRWLCYGGAGGIVRCQEISI